MEKFELLLKVLAGMDKIGVLKSFVLVGSWCQDFYRMRFGQPLSIPAARTTDADILVPRGIRVDQPVDVSKVLEDNDFVVATDYLTGSERYTHPRLDVEFLTTARAGPRESVHHFKELGIKAQELRFMDIPLQYYEPVEYRGLIINIPEPEAYVIQKLLVSTRRTSKAKVARDLEVAKGLLLFFEERNRAHVERLWEIYEALPKGGQRRIQEALNQAGLQFPSPQSDE